MGDEHGRRRVHQVAGWIATVIVVCSFVIGPFLILSTAIFAWPISDPEFVRWVRHMIAILFTFFSAVFIMYIAIAYGPVVKRYA